MLEVLGVDVWGESAYLCLVDGPALTVEELASRTGIDQDNLKGALIRLEDRGLVSRMPGRPTRYRALPPEHALEVLLLARERDIHRVRALAQHLAERHRKAQVGRDSASLIEVITGPDGVARCGQQLFRRAEREIRGIDAPPYAKASNGERVNSSLNIGGRRVRSRFIHAHDALRVAGGVRRIEGDIAAGEEVRFLPQTPMKMILADDQAGLIPLLATPQVLDSCILVYPSALLDALSTLFETLWQHAQPYIPEQTGQPDDDALPEEDRRIIALLAMGLSDEAIARQLGIGHRTIQRRVQALLARLGATSRFQAGILAASRGWWRPET
ncbi:helix-turn-helix domain-containing protein [Rugosimonospora acidiphila]|uniref:helix-turn-helix domain-containing protein n=1 Tax=Rugosimonospora acidiphila TaxID=556531 RepID=UPI0031E68DBC